jgi:hypothetical protein
MEQVTARVATAFIQLKSSTKLVYLEIDSRGGLHKYCYH